MTQHIKKGGGGDFADVSFEFLFDIYKAKAFSQLLNGSYFIN